MGHLKRGFDDRGKVINTLLDLETGHFGIRSLFFDGPDVHRQRLVDVPPVQHGPPVFHCGWPDRILVYRFGVRADAELISWGTCETIASGMDCAPIRGVVLVTPNYQMMPEVLHVTTSDECRCRMS